jgi:hypothetical protein
MHRIRALVLYCNGFPGWRRVAVDTAAAGAAPIVRALPGGLRRNHLVRRLLEGAAHNQKSYAQDWLEAFVAEPRLDAYPCNVANLLSFRRALRQLPDFDLVVVLHSASTTTVEVLARAAASLQARRGKLLLFVGNEFRQMQEKIRFANAVAADYIATQLTLEAGRWLYAGCPSATVLSGLHGLNEQVYRPGPAPRQFDLGFRGDRYNSFALGDQERESILDYFEHHAAGFGLSARFEYSRSFRDDWAEFLASCRGTVGAEAGTHYLERTDETQGAVLRFLDQHPAASFDEVFARFFRDYRNPVSGKTLSSRHFEAIGTKTCQILLEGHYSGVLVPDVHYIALRKDFSNAAECISRFKDEAERQRIVDQAYDHVRESHTYAHRVRQLVDAVFP